MSEPQSIEQLLPGLKHLRDQTLAGAVAATWRTAWNASGLGERIRDLPFYVLAPNETLLRHVDRVVELALALEQALARDGAPAIDHDLLIAVCLLHDVDKLCLLEPDTNGAWRGSSMAKRYPHGVLGAMFCRENGLSDEIVHIVATHATDSKLPPEPFEGVVMHYADLLAADAALFEAGAELLMARGK